MKYLLPLIVAALTSCAQFEGSGYKATFVMTDLKAYQQSADQITITGMKQSTVPVAVTKAVRDVTLADIAVKVPLALTNNSTKEVLGQQATARSIAAGKEATKQLSLTEGTVQQGLKLQPPVILPR